MTRGGGPVRFRPGWSWTVSSTWVISSLTAAVTLILSVVLGAVVPLVTDDWDQAQTRDQAWVLAVLTAFSVVAGVIAVFLRRKRRQVLTGHGTAYVLYELVENWASQKDEQKLRADADRYFARVIDVPGPGKLDRSWNWPLDDRAREWDDKVTELVRSFQILHSDDDPQTPNGVLMWASWAVAAAFCMRVTAADRDLVLDVWQRSSKGRAGEVSAELASANPHRFRAADPPHLAGILPGSQPEEVTWPDLLKITPRVRRTARAEQHPVSVLLLRLGASRWGPLRAVGDTAGTDGPKEVLDFAGVTTGSSPAVAIHEFRCLPPDGGNLFPWHVFPSLAAEAASWIERKAAELDGHALLLGTTMPQEISLGLGISAGREAHPGWPTDMWPAIHRQSTDTLVIPRLNLGTAPIRRAGM